MTQPPEQPPQGGFGPPGQPPHGDQPQFGAPPPPPPPPGPPYSGGGPYGAGGPYGGGGQWPPPPGPPPGPPPSGGPGRRKVALIAAGVAVVLALGGVGAYAATGGFDDDSSDDKPEAKRSAPEKVSEEPSPEETEPEPTPEDTSDDSYGDGPTDGPTDDPADDPGSTARPSGKGLRGVWQTDYSTGNGATLGIYAKETSGQFAGKRRVSYLSSSKNVGFCVGYGDERDGGKSIRIALQCRVTEQDGKKKVQGGTGRESGDSITVRWDDGKSEKFDWKRAAGQ